MNDVLFFHLFLDDPNEIISKLLDKYKEFNICNFLLEENPSCENPSVYKRLISYCTPLFFLKLYFYAQNGVKQLNNEESILYHNLIKTCVQRSERCSQILHIVVTRFVELNCIYHDYRGTNFFIPNNDE